MPFPEFAGEVRAADNWIAMSQTVMMIVLEGAGEESESQVLVSKAFATSPQLSGLCPRIVPVSQFEACEVERCDLIIVDPGEPGDLLPFRAVIDESEQADVPIMTICSGTSPGLLGGTIALMVKDGPEVAGAKIEVILDRQTVVKRQQAELRISQRFQGGLRGEISRIHDELQLAAQVQQEFLPRSYPRLHGIEFGALWRPANYVSGDIFDIARLDEDHIGVFLADAVGHGVPAALMTMVIARALPTKEVTGNSYRLVPPDEALRRLNGEMIRRQGETTRFATAVYALIDCRSRTAHIAGAGHPPPILYRDGQEPVGLESPGGLLGVFEDETFESITVELQRDDRLMFYSDGFEVAFPEEESQSARDMRLPTRRYFQEFREISQLASPDAMIEAIGSRIDSQPGSLHQTDDLTLICMKAGAIIGQNSDEPTRAVA